MSFQHVMPWNSLNNPYIELVQSGEVALTDTNTSVTDTITSVTKNKSFLVFSWKYSESREDPEDTFVKGAITNSTTLTFSRSTSTGDCTIRWFVVTFKAVTPCSVEHSTHTLTSVSDSVSISSVDQNHAFPVISYNGVTSFPGAKDWVGAQITSPNNIQFTVDTFDTGMDIEYQIVSCPFWDVYEYTSSALAADTTEDVSLSPAVDLTRSFMFVSGTMDAGQRGDEYFRHRFVNSSTIQALRGDAGAAMEMIYYIIEAGPEIVTQQASAITIATSQNQEISGGLNHNINNSIVLFNRMQISSGTTNAFNNDMNNNGIMAYIYSATQIALERGFANATITTTGDFTVIDFTKAI